VAANESYMLGGRITILSVGYLAATGVSSILYDLSFVALSMVDINLIILLNFLSSQEQH